MKITKRISVSLLVLIMVLSAVLAIPASAVPGDGALEYFSSSCTDQNFTAYAQSSVSTGGVNAYARTYFTHSGNLHPVSGTAYVAAEFWHYPSGSSQANYQTTTRTANSSDSSTTPMTSSRVSATASVSKTTSMGVVFAIESTHTLTLVCNGLSTGTKTIRLTAGEPAMK